MATTIASLLIKIGVQVSEVNKGFKQVENKMNGLKGKFQKNGAKIAAIFGGIGAAVTTGLISAVKAAGKFETELVGLGRIAGVSGKELNDLGRDAMKMGSQMGIASRDVVKGMADMAKLGYKTNEILKEMPHIMKFAKVKSLDFATALGLAESAMSVFKLGVGGAKKVTDTFLYTMEHSTASIDDLKLGFKYAAPAAKAAGLSVGELSAAIGILAKNGTTGSTAGTTLRMALNRLASDAPAVKKGLNDLGVSITDSSGKFKPFKQIVEEMGKSLSDMSPKQQLATANMIFGTNAGSGMLKILKEGPGVFTEFANGAENAGGAVDKAFKDKQKTFEETMARLKVSAENFGISIGIALGPAVTEIIDGITKIIDKFNDLDPETQQLIGYIAAAIAVFTVLTGVVAAAAVVFGLLSLPILAIIAAIALLVAAFLYYQNNSEKVNAAVKAGWEAVKNWFASIPAWFGKLWDKVVAATSKAWTSIKTKVSDIWTSIKQTFSDMVSGAVKWGKDMFTKFGDGIVAGFRYVKQKVIDAANWVKSKLGFSLPDSGPLADADTWMPDFMKLLASGIEMGIPKLQMAVGDVTSTIADVGSTDGVSSSTVNNNVNVYPRHAHLDARGLNRELERMRFLNGGSF